MQRQFKHKKKGSKIRKTSTAVSKYNNKLPLISSKGGKHYTFYVYLTFSKSVCTIRDVPKSILIRDFKKYLVLTCGVPYSIQRLHYLDSCELNDNESIRDSLDIVDNASFRLGVWSNFEKLMRSVHENDVESLLTCNIQDPDENRNQHNDDLSNNENSEKDKSNSDENLPVKQNLKEYRKYAGVALFVASQVGQLNIIKKLLEMGVDTNWTSELGYTSLHAATACGHYECIDYLLQNGAYCDTKSEQAKTAMKIAEVYGFNESERHLRSFEWQSRAKNVKASPNTPLLMHQMCDSKNPTWINGEYSTKYFSSTLPRAVFSGTRIDAPKSKAPTTPDTRTRYKVLPDIHVPKNVSGNNVKQVAFASGLSFDEWLSNKKQQAIISMQDSIDIENLLQQEKEEQEKKRRTKKLTLYEEEKKRKSRRVRDTEWNKGNIYEEYKYLPSYQTSIIHQYMNELMLEGE